MFTPEFPSLDRRDFLKLGLAATAAALPATSPAKEPLPKLIDTNVHFSRWPTRRLPNDDPARLARFLRDHGVTHAWTGSFDALVQKNLGAVNSRLAADCRRYGRDLFVPFGSINPKSPDWEEDLRRCVEGHRMRGIRLHPNYHGYKLGDAQFARLFRMATDYRLIIQIVLVMEDERMMHPLMRVEPVDTSSLASLLKELPAARIVLLNALRTLRGKQLTDLLAAGNIYVEIAQLEGMGGLSNLLGSAPANRILFGSHAPFFYFEAALLKLKESLLTRGQLQAIQFANAERVQLKPM